MNKYQMNLKVEQTSPMHAQFHNYIHLASKQTNVKFKIVNTASMNIDTKTVRLIIPQHESNSGVRK